MRQLRGHVGSGVAPALDKFDGWVSERFAFAEMAGERGGRDTQRLARRRRTVLLAGGPSFGVARP